jgi:hypothetical protein
MLRLLVTHGPEEQIFALPEGVAKLGCAGENDIILRIPGVSRRHALVRRHSGGVEVNDLGSRNGLLVEGQRVKRAALTPGLRVQVGAAWLEVEEVSTSEEAFARLSESSSGGPVSPSPMTANTEPLEALRNLSSEKAALTLAYHIAQVGVGTPENRADLLLRIKATLGAEAFATLERTRSGRLRIWEIVGTFSPAETKLFTPLAGDRRTTVRDAFVLKREGKILLSGRESWFLAAKFAEESLAREGWRKEFLQFLASQFFRPVRTLEDMERAEAHRVRILTRNNKSRTARLLGTARNTLAKLLKQGRHPERPRK